jgi:hypothetical protein
MSGRIKKGKLKTNYTVVPNEPLRDRDLSWKAKGLLVYLLSMDEEWVVYKKDLSKRSKDGYDSTDSAFKELENHGYIINEGKSSNELGLFSGNDYSVFPTPQIKLSDTDNPDRIRHGLSDTVNPQLRSTTTPYSSSSTNPKKKYLFTPPTIDDVKQYFNEKGYTEESAIRAFNYYEAGDWSDGRGNKVKSWKQKMVGVWFKPENKKPLESIDHSQLSNSMKRRMGLLPKI